MTSQTGRTWATTAAEKPLRAVLLEIARALETGDVHGLLSWCVDRCSNLSGATAAAVVDMDPAASAEAWRVTATDESVRELIELDLDLPTGLCRHCLDTGEVSTIPDLFSSHQRSEFAAGARRLRFTWSHARPLRLRGNVIGALHLFGDLPEIPEDLDVELAHAVAELVLVTGVQQHALDVRSTEVAQLHTALDSRLVIEQAKGILAARHDIDVEQAFVRLRKYARDHRTNIHDVARKVVQNQAPDLP